MMAKRKKAKHKQFEELGLFHDLKTYVDSVAQGEMRKGRLYSNCIRASFAKAYEFNVNAWDHRYAETSFFWLPTLRGICEDLIVLNYIQQIPHAERETLMDGLLRHELNDCLKVQRAFFKHNRPHQGILKPFLTMAQLESLEDKIRDVWRAHGWPNMNKKVIPPTRQIAEKHGGDVLATLYDYMYRLTSRTVHFNVQGLMRTGWGDIPHGTFSPTHFSLYYAMFGRIYGAFMFCCYFELFARFLRTNDDTKATIKSIKQAILSTPRWPEMVTPEELNVEPPKIGFMEHTIAIIQSETQKQLLK